MNDAFKDGVVDLDRVLQALPKPFQRLDPDIQLIESTPSTMTFAWDNQHDGAGDGFVVLAEHQTAGRGRMGRRWQSPRGASILCSLLIINSDRFPGPNPETLGLIAGIATAQAVRDTTDIRARIDWPNDILVGQKKLAGVLIESRVLDSDLRAHVIGIGINCLQQRSHFPDALRDRSTSLDLESDDPIDRERTTAALLARLDEWLADPDRWDPDHVADAFRQLAGPFGQRVHLRHKGRIYTGQVIDVDPSAALVVMLDDGVRSVFPAAETTLIRHDIPERGA